MIGTPRIALPLLALALAACASSTPRSAPPAAPTSGRDDAARVAALAGEYLREYVARFPEEAEGAGLTVARHDGLTDNSLAARREWDALEDRWAAALAGVDGAALRGRPEWVTYGMLRERVDASRGLRVCRSELWPVSQMSGWQAGVAAMAGFQPVGTPELRAQALARWGRLPRYIDTEVDNLREGLRLGYSTPRRNVQLVIEQLDALLAAPPEQSPFWGPAERDSAPEFRAAWAALLRDQVLPAARRYRDFLASTYLPAAREAIGVSANPNGRECYRAFFRGYTTLDRAPEETFRLGQERVARNAREAGALGLAAYGTGSLDSLSAAIAADPALRFRDRDEVRAFAEAAVERARLQVPRWFGAMPRAAVVVEPHPAFLEQTAFDQYFPAADDGSRPAQYRINLYRPEDQRRSQVELTAFHETYPGHHLQIGLASDLTGQHPVTQLMAVSAFVEGWARYAESLSEEMGLYTTDAARISRRMWPARGMVVDPGIHVLGWSREQALEWIMASGRTQRQAEALVDRVVVWPGQLTAYDTGALEFFALRRQAEQALGDRFDIREFHDALLRNGSVTLPMLRESVEAWIAGPHPASASTSP